MYTFWEITSLCSFLLIGYSQTNEAIHNSCKALWMNLFGAGLPLHWRSSFWGEKYYTVELSLLVNLGRSREPVELIAALLVFCGLRNRR